MFGSATEGTGCEAVVYSAFPANRAPALPVFVATLVRQQGENRRLMTNPLCSAAEFRTFIKSIS